MKVIRGGLIRGAGIGAALMYFFDPERGGRRRAMARDKLTRVAHVTGDSVGTAARDVANRARGVAAGARSLVQPDDADDDVIQARVRTALGRFVSHPHAIHVTVDQGRVTLDGNVLEDEAAEIVARVPRVRGVVDVLNRLRVRRSAEGIPSLQGGRMQRPRGVAALSDEGAADAYDREDRIHEGRIREHWSPAERLMSGVAGGALALMGARRRGGLGTAAGLAGLALLTRGATNRRLRTMVGANGGATRAIDVQKTINIHAPVEQVYAALTEWGRFPEWMTHVRDVRSMGPRGEVGERTHWVVDGPAGTKVSWDAETTGLVPNEFVSWKSVEGATVRQAGSIRFQPTAEGTRVQVQMSYLPPAGVVGHAVAALFGRDPRRQMHDDLARLKTMIETGVPARDAAQEGDGAPMDQSLRVDPSL